MGLEPILLTVLQHSFVDNAAFPEKLKEGTLPQIPLFRYS